MNGPCQGLSTQSHQMLDIFSLKKKIKLTLRVKLSFELRAWFLVVAVDVCFVYLFSNLFSPHLLELE